MAISLYDVSVKSFLQTLDAMSGFLDKGEAFFREHSIDPESVVEARLFPDMLPFRFQVHMAMHYSLNGTRAALNGTFGMLMDKPNHDYDGLRMLIADTRSLLRAVTPEAVDACAGGEVLHKVGDYRQLYATEDFLLSFALPSFYFHVTTAYDILRMKGVPIGKRDYLGTVRVKA